MNAQEMRELATESKPKRITKAIESIEERIKEEASNGALSTILPIYLHGRSDPLGCLNDINFAKNAQEHFASKGFDVHFTTDQRNKVDFFHIIWGEVDG